MSKSETFQRGKKMAGWKVYNGHTGEVETGLYERPFIVRATPRKLGYYDRPEDTTIASFRTAAEADEWLRRNEANYKQGQSGFASLHVENWNE
jgi:hypothetical protein